MQIVDSAYAGASGLEHQNSHVDVLAPSYVGSEFQPSLYAHEIFHSWNVKRLRPAEMWPYRYSRPQPTPWLWVSRGDHRLLRRSRRSARRRRGREGFYALTAEKINEVMTRAPVALEDASLNTWVHPVDGTEYIYYPKGSLAGLMLDIMIRDASDNKKSLDDVMRGLYQSDVQAAAKDSRRPTGGTRCRAAANGKSFAEFTRRYIDGREPFPWDSILPLAGLRVHQERVPRLGVMTQRTEWDRRARCGAGSSAARAGVRPGDYLVSIGDIGVEDQQFGAQFVRSTVRRSKGRRSRSRSVAAETH